MPLAAGLTVAGRLSGCPGGRSLASLAMPSCRAVLVTTLLVLAGSQLVAGGSKQLFDKCGIVPTARDILAQYARRRRQVWEPPVVHRGRMSGGRLWYDKNVSGGAPALSPSPWVALVGKKSSYGTVRWDCGATLLSHSLVMIAAHCINKEKISQLVVRLGEHDTTTTLDGQHHDVSVANVSVHPDYRRFPSMVSDMALLRLKENVRFSADIWPACLPESDVKPGTNVTLLGFGSHEVLAPMSTTLYEANLTVLDDGKCEKRLKQKQHSFQKSYRKGLPGTILCANGSMTAEGVMGDACQGDSGGPLLQTVMMFKYDKHTGPWQITKHQVIGVVSAGIGCGSPTFPGLYTEVSKFTSWILKTAAVI